MSINVLKNKTNALYLKNKSKKINKPTFIRNQFMNCCQNNEITELSNEAKLFSINGGTRSNSYVGKQYLMSSLKIQNQYDSNSEYIKPSVVNHSSHIKRKLARNQEVVKPIDSGTNKSDNHSQGAYIERKKTCNSHIFDVNQDEKYKQFVGKNCENCKEKDIMYTKRIKQPLSMEDYISYKKMSCLQTFTKAKGIGKTSCV